MGIASKAYWSDSTITFQQKNILVKTFSVKQLVIFGAERNLDG